MTLKEHKEKVTKSIYVRQRGDNIRKNEDEFICFHCSRSGVHTSLLIIH